MKKWFRHVSSAALSLILIFASIPALAASSSSDDQQLSPVDQGTGSDVLENASYFGDLPDNTPITVDIVLKARKTSDLYQVIDRSVDPKSPTYHHYLSVSEFRKNFGASEKTVQDITSYLRRYGIDSKVYPDHLVITASGTAGAFNKAFSVSIQKAKFKGKTFHATRKNPMAPKFISTKILAILGLSDYSEFTPHSVKRPVKIEPEAGTGPLNLDPADLIKQYNVDPLYKQGERGQKQTIGIVTLADFNPEDAYAFWKKEGIDVKDGRISVKPVDGGSDWNGYEETTLDVEQSGALAPDANINVYIGPNSDTGFVDTFASAINENQAAQISVSWGLSETILTAAIQAKVESPAYAEVFNLLFAQAAAQGISMFAAAGDAGAYDASRDLGTYNLAVDNPADSPYITAAGGTTLPWSGTMKNGTTIENKKERAWGWDYLYPYFDSRGLNNPEGWAGHYFVGGGGGFSTYFPTPQYQRNVPGVNHFTAVRMWQPSPDFTSVSRLSEPETVTGTGSGRNLPDVSLNADPYTGYKVYLSDPGNPGSNAGWATYGGTSFVSPQLNGLNALMNSGQKERIGFWNDQIYPFAGEKDSPFHPLNESGPENDNLYFTGTEGTIYNQSTGLGTIDVASLADHFSHSGK
ncbi:peptidase S53 [Sporolactobacillus sp. THM7-4]|nr:peptidase S53 [Sporolactobacillus sp. THM7-4]